MPTTSFEEVWERIKQHAGETFYTKRGLPFTYEVRGDVFLPSRTGYAIAKTDFRKAYERVPFEGPGEINYLVRGPAYIWAVLHDRRISKGDW